MSGVGQFQEDPPRSDDEEVELLDGVEEDEDANEDGSYDSGSGDSGEKRSRRR